MHPYPNKERLAPSPSNQGRAELNGSYTAIPWKGHIAWGEVRSWESTKESSSVLDVQGQKVYKCSFFGPYLLCVHPEASESLLEQLHERIYGSHTGGRSLSHRAITQGYWWLGLQKEAQEYVRKCDQCQRFAPNIHQLGGVLNPLSSPWPFAQWGLNIVGPFPKALGNKKNLLVNTDYFTKWVKTKPLANIRDVNVKRFI